MSVEITVKINGADMTLDEARALYSELHKLFNVQIAQPSLQVKMDLLRREGAKAYAEEAYRAMQEALVGKGD